jgi:hypothetical protein
MNEILCPVCSRPNPEDQETCQFCGATLIPPAGVPQSGSSIRAGDTPVVKQTSEFEKVKLPDDSPIHAGETPVPRDTGELEQALPTWLRSLREKGELPEAESPADASAAAGLSVASPASQPPDTSGESLDWLAGLGQEEEEEQIPDWLAGLRSSAEPAAPEAAQPAETDQPEGDWTSGAPSGEEALPEWFTRFDQQAKPAEAEASIPAQTAPPAEGQPADEALPAESLPAWLDALQAEADETPEAAMQEETHDWLTGAPSGIEGGASTESMPEPDWLKNLGQESAAPQAEPSQAAPESEMPDWLAALGAESAAGSEAGAGKVFSEELPAEEPVRAEIPEWLAGFQLGESVPQTDEQAGADEQSAEASSGALAEPVPDWLAGLQKAVPSGGVPALMEGGEIEAQPPVPQESPETFSLETPDWLARLRPERSVETADAEPAEGAQPDNLEMAELPSWVQAMKPVEAVVSDAKSAAPEQAGVSESSGPLAGLRGVLPGGAAILASHKPPAYSIKLQVTETQHKYAQQLEKMILEEGKPKGPKPEPVPSSRLWRWAISIILILAVFLPLAAGSQFAPDLALFPSEWERTYTLLDSLPGNAAVLVVFDYDPALSSELQAAAAPVIDRILSHGARLTLLSTSPTGPALAAQFLQSTQAAHLEAGMQYANLGYLPGGPSAIYYFAADPRAAVPQTVDGNDAWSLPSLQGVGGLSDFDALLVITDNADTARAWVEQTQNSIGDTAVVMIISAQAEPMVRPYYDSGQVDGMVTGLVGGKTYEQSFGTSGLARRYWDSFGTGTLAAVFLILVGGTGGALMAWRGRRKGGTA